MLFCFISEQAIIGLTALALFFAQNTVPPLTVTLSLTTTKLFFSSVADESEGNAGEEQSVRCGSD